MTLSGNIQYDALTLEQMAGAVRRTLDECMGRQFILSPTANSAGPFDEDVPDSVIRNYMFLWKLRGNTNALHIDRKAQNAPCRARDG